VNNASISVLLAHKVQSIAFNVALLQEIFKIYQLVVPVMWDSTGTASHAYAYRVTLSARCVKIVLTNVRFAKTQTLTIHHSVYNVPLISSSTQ
jgi:hypothetical protein